MFLLNGFRLLTQDHSTYRPSQDAPIPMVIAVFVPYYSRDKLCRDRTGLPQPIVTVRKSFKCIIARTIISNYHFDVKYIIRYDVLHLFYDVFKTVPLTRLKASISSGKMTCPCKCFSHFFGKTKPICLLFPTRFSE